MISLLVWYRPWLNEAMRSYNAVVQPYWISLTVSSRLQGFSRKFKTVGNIDRLCSVLKHILCIYYEYQHCARTYSSLLLKWPFSFLDAISGSDPFWWTTQTNPRLVYDDGVPQAILLSITIVQIVSVYEKPIFCFLHNFWRFCYNLVKNHVRSSRQEAHILPD